MRRRTSAFVLATLTTLTVLTTLATLASGCDEGPPTAYIDISLVTPAGESPLEGIDTLAVTVRQGLDEPQVATGTATADGFSLDLPIVDFARPVDIAVELTGGGTRLIGGAPTLIPAETGTAGDGTGLVVIAVGPPRSCAIVDGMVVTCDVCDHDLLVALAWASYCTPFVRGVVGRCWWLD